ncbi:hypothetical protein C0989_005802 [Termitomyces sp. Mn162]|nr:hypothetical protein C0989_005802 [Termitomyces sp. Mn162]
MLNTSPIKLWSEEDDIGSITAEECCKLVNDVTVVKALEDLFSFRQVAIISLSHTNPTQSILSYGRHKDRTSRISLLNSVESLRFRRAMYRLMLIAKIFPADEYEFEDEDDEDFDPTNVERDRLARRKLLDDFSTAELLELHSASLFLIELAEGISVGESGRPGEISGDVVLARGPAMVLQAYRLITAGDLHGNLETGNVPPSFVGYLSNPLKEILEERKTKPLDNYTHWTSLLEDIRGANDTCKFILSFVVAHIYTIRQVTNVASLLV